jgi:hypothetical protein
MIIPTRDAPPDDARSISVNYMVTGTTTMTAGATNMGSAATAHDRELSKTKLF